MSGRCRIVQGKASRVKGTINNMEEGYAPEDSKDSPSGLE